MPAEGRESGTRGQRERRPARSGVYVRVCARARAARGAVAGGARVTWPAVSQICSLIRLPSRVMVRILKSIPIVVMKLCVKESSANRTSMALLPTPAETGAAGSGARSACDPPRGKWALRLVSHEGDDDEWA